ncbi:MAG: acyl-CoA dehydrogenase [Acidimicrobiia bacterium]|nr:acyl-CoA dehydrogenase [Acidimicrobiia bacterium]MYB75063.1 acyl-CoA dehydrogenase [Acidimicrobiia bacterium]MYH99986.1 acyl-CoA dehydrogenase [Acidimicrobiia bacterium]
MNFDFSESQEAVAALAEQVFSGSAGSDRVAEVERNDERFDRELWAALAASDLLGVAIGEEHGGLGLGMVETALVLREQGRRVAPVPLWPTLVLGAMPIAEFGSGPLRDRWLGAVVDGQAVLTGALSEWGADDALSPSVTAARLPDGGWELNGSKPAVPAAGVADAVVVPARVLGADDRGDLAVFVVDLDADGVEVTLSETTSRELHGELTLRSVVVGEGAVLGGADGRTIVEWMLVRAQVAVAAVVLGCCEEATAMAAAYTSEREQFGRPLSTNQGVAMRAADCYIDTDCMRVTLLQAAWLIDEGRSAVEVADAAAVAKWWSADAGQRVVHATQHLHGGMGADIDYPVHRYFLWVKQLENTFGGGSRQLAAIGRALAG